MADTRPVDLALTTERPASPEVAGILVICALVFAALVHFDGAAARHEAVRARAELARRAAERPTPGPTERRHPGGDIGDAGPISVPVGGAWSSGTSPAVAHAKPGGATGGPPAAVLALMAAVGAMMAATGAALLLRGSR